MTIEGGNGYKREQSYSCVYACVSLFMSVILSTSNAIADTSKIDFWNTQRKGANQQNERHRPEWYEEAGKLGLDYVRILPDAWPTDSRDFLIGNADYFEAINETDLALLIEALNEAEMNGIKVVLTMVSLPGARWKQLNDDQDDGRLWRDEIYHKQAFEFWRQLAIRLRGHPAIVAYNPLNEPHPDKVFGFEEPDENFAKWFQGIQNTPADLNLFNQRMVESIRSVDSDTPIMLDGWFYAAPQAFDFNRPIDDDKILYAFHNPGPWQMVTYRVNKGKYAYPDRVPKSWDGPVEPWTMDRLGEEMNAVQQFSQRYDIPSNRIIASEFWYDRRLEGAANYLGDLIEIYNRQNWHWSFYAYRGDGSWTGLDYEIAPDRKMGWRYWQAIETGKDPEHLKPRDMNPLWKILKHQFRQN